MIVGIIDIGSNTARLLVASVEGERTVIQKRRERHYLRLGDDVYALGRIGPEKLKEAGEVARSFARMATKSAVELLETIVTAPGRQAANGDKLVRVLTKATHSPVVVLTGLDEGRLAWEGAVARMEHTPQTVAVVDLGGGSCELALGTPGLGPDWVRSLDVGALRVTRTFLEGDPPSPKRVRRAQVEIRSLVSEFDPSRPDTTLAVGGTARAIGRMIGRRFDVERLEELATTLSSATAASATKAHGVTLERAETLLGGTLVLAEIARLLETELEVGCGGLREGAALALARRAAVAA